MLRHAAAAEAIMERPAPPPGDHARLEQMFKEHRGVVWRMLRCRGLAPDVAVESTQEVFLVAAQRLADIAVGKERAFLIGTALHVAQAAHRTRARWALTEDVDLLDEHVATLDHRGAALDIIGKILSRVDDPLVEVFVLHEIAEFSSFEIAELLGVPRGTVASRLRLSRGGCREAARRVERRIGREQGEA